jgi:hypothetical protein
MVHNPQYSYISPNPAVPLANRFVELRFWMGGDSEQGQPRNPQASTPISRVGYTTGVQERSRATEVVRFGVFEANRKTGEWRKSGVRIRLQDQPFQILLMLLDRPGEVVSREEIQRQLWPDGTFVEFEHSIGTAIKKLRQALGDDADTPRYIEALHAARVPVHRALGVARRRAAPHHPRPSQEGSHSPRSFFA